MLHVARGGLLPTILVCLLATGCLQQAPESAPAPTPTPIAELDTSAMVIERQPFCDRIPDAAVERAIGGELAELEEWGEGDEGSGDTDDVNHEFGCSWSSDRGVEARTWVFARPVTDGFARQVVRQTSAKQDCTAPTAPAFGQPSQLQVCKLGGGVLRVRHAGLFGDAYLSCEVAEPTGRPAQLKARAAAWCVEVANALDVG